MNTYKLIMSDILHMSDEDGIIEVDCLDEIVTRHLSSTAPTYEQIEAAVKEATKVYIAQRPIDSALAQIRALYGKKEGEK